MKKLLLCLLLLATPVYAGQTYNPSTGTISSLTTTGSSGASTFIGGVLNIPIYSGGGGAGLSIGTTTITGGTNTYIEYNNNGVLGEYSVTGNGTTAVLSTSPTFITGLTSPLIIGGTGAASTLTLESTSGTGTTDSIVFKTGSQVQAVQINTAGKVGIGTTNFGSLANIGGNLSIGKAYSNIAGPTNGAIIQGNVGIGSSSPAYPLDILAGNGADALVIHQTNDSSTSMHLYSNGASAYNAISNGINIADSTRDFLVLANQIDMSSSSSRILFGSFFNIDGSVSIGTTYAATSAPTNGAIVQGSVGIGTTVPQNSTKIHIIGTEELGQVGSTLGSLLLAGNTSGLVTIAPQAAAGTYNFNLPITAGSAGQVLTSQGGSSTAMTWSTALTGSGGTPTCGTGCASITAGSTDVRGSMVSGSSVSSVTLNFSGMLASAPFCTISDSNTSATADISSISTSALTVSLASALTSVTIYWNCPL